MKLIDKGYTAEIYDYENNKICKLFKDNFPRFIVEHEFNNAKIFETTEIKVPKTYNIIELDNRTGIIYEKIYGVTVNKKINEDGRLDYWISRMAELHKYMLEFHIDKGISHKEFLKITLGDKNKENECLYSDIEKLPDGNCLCHGDFHPSNIIINDKDELFVIDFMNICYGPWYYDVARTYVLLEGFKNYAKIQDVYLSIMGVEYRDIEKYVLIIHKCRKFELQNF